MRYVKELWLGKRENYPDVIVEIVLENENLLPAGYHYHSYNTDGTGDGGRFCIHCGTPEHILSFVQGVHFPDAFEWVKLG